MTLLLVRTYLYLCTYVYVYRIQFCAYTYRHVQVTCTPACGGGRGGRLGSARGSVTCIHTYVRTVHVYYKLIYVYTVRTYVQYVWKHTRYRCPPSPCVHEHTDLAVHTVSANVQVVQYHSFLRTRGFLSGLYVYCMVI